MGPRTQWVIVSDNERYNLVQEAHNSSTIATLTVPNNEIFSTMLHLGQTCPNMGGYEDIKSVYQTHTLYCACLITR